MSSKDNDEERVMHSKRDNVEIMIKDEADKVIVKLFQLLLSRCQIGLEISMKGSDYIFDYIFIVFQMLQDKSKLRQITYGFTGFDKK